MSEHVFPAIVAKFSCSSTELVTVQQDGATPHTGKDVVARLNSVGATLDPKIVVITQPARSPDMNVCDLGLPRSLDVHVRKARRELGNKYCKDQSVKDVLQVVSSYSKDTLSLIWHQKAEIMGKVVMCAGRNDYNRHSLSVPDT